MPSHALSVAAVGAVCHGGPMDQRLSFDEVLATAEAAGAADLRPAVQRDWGGYSGYFSDPAGFRWEVAYNPGPIGQEVLP
jgi:uncharacterized glyoxalase superfamily protein PhnB